MLVSATDGERDMTADQAQIDVLQRNALRRSVCLPPLVVDVEVERRLTVESNREFEQAFADHRQLVEGAWTKPNEGWLSRSARWSLARTEVRKRFDRVRNQQQALR